MSKSKILIVDDNPTNLEILEETLKGDYRLVIAKDGHKAIELAKLGTPDLILLDVVMPQMNGYEACKQIKQNPDTRDIPVIFITSMSEIDNKVRGFELGAVDYITKPFVAAEVKARIKTHLSLKKMRKNLNEKNILLEQKITILKETQDQLAISARQAGMAEIAVSVLHNIGNAINTVNIRRVRMEEGIKTFDIRYLEKIYDFIEKADILFNQIEEPSAKKEKLLQFLKITIDLYGKIGDKLKNELRELKKALGQIEEIIAIQKKYADLPRFETQIDVNALIKDATDLLMDSMIKSDIEVIFELSQIPPVTLDKNKMLQIFINSIKNAYEAIVTSTEDILRKIVIKSSIEWIEDKSYVKIEIQDTGVGLSPQVKPHVFQSNFSTKGQRFSLGLHDAANYIRSKGGLIDLTSQGTGKGAVLMMHLPAQI